MVVAVVAVASVVVAQIPSQTSNRQSIMTWQAASRHGRIFTNMAEREVMQGIKYTGMAGPGDQAKPDLRRSYRGAALAYKERA